MHKPGVDRGDRAVAPSCDRFQTAETIMQGARTTEPTNEVDAASGQETPRTGVTGLHILIVEDEPVLARNLRRSLQAAGHNVESVDTGEAALTQVQKLRPDLVLLDNRLPGMSGLETLKAMQAHDPSVLVIIMTAFGTIEDAVTAMKLGASDFLRKPIGLAELEIAIERAVKNERLQQELRYHRGQRDGRVDGGMIGRSEAMRQVQRTVERLRGVLRARGGGPTILITGETGTGKGLLARTLHAESSRSAGPFIEVNCTAIPDTLLEAELFGYERGAFTDARTAKPGLIEAAEGGTLFLDEIGHVGSAAQGKLLKVIEERALRRLGSVRDRPTDVWILAATNRDLEQAVRRGEFREDLYHRLRVLGIAVPPLRERGDDVLELAEHFLASHAARYGVAVPQLSASARAALQAYRWPGNVRELANVMERAVLLAESPTLEPRDLAMLPAEVPAGGFRVTFPAEGIVWAELEKSLIEQALAQAGGNQVRAAKLLGLSRDALRYRMEKHGVVA
jgi:DNA-binding NtrC family response regulator